MERGKAAAAVRTYVIAALVIALMPVASCKKEEQQSRKAPVQSVNPYASDSVFLEVKKKLEENPKDVDAWFHLGDLYERNAQYTEAIDAYKKVIGLKPDMGYAYLKMGTAYDRLNQPAEAVKTLRMATQRMPRFAVGYNNLGVAYGKLGKFDEEIAALQRAIKLRPSYAGARYNLGMTFLKVKNKKAAMRQYESLKEFDEGAAEALLKEINKAS
jgi:tetratricopeptide (TPR) repeat protein